MNKKKIDDAILTLEVLIDCCKEDGTTYNAIKEWEALEVFKDLANRIDKAIEFIEMEVGIIPRLYGGYMARDELTKVGIGELYEILKGEDNGKN